MKRHDSASIRFRWLIATAVLWSLAFTGVAGAEVRPGTGSILVTNHAFVTGVTNPAQFTVLDVYVADTGYPLHRPFIF